MPRRGNDEIALPEPPKKKNKVFLEEPSSFCDDDEALASGLIFTDVQQGQWRIGKAIGRGSFGRIYLASDEVNKEVTKANARYVVKIEPHTNGPLFVEIHCLIRTAQANKVKEWRQNKNLKRFGMPVYIASGSFTDQATGTKYRFLVLPRYDLDLQKVITRTRVLDLKNVLVLAIQILDVLEYLHSQGYTHSDIKSSNLMLGFDGGKYSKFALPKPMPSFQKETKEVAVLSGKPRKAKTGKSRGSNYYDDEDFIIKDHKSGFNYLEEDEKDKRLARVKNKLRKILSDKDSRTLHRHHAFNLRQLSSYVNYHEDFGSSVCSDQSYQRLLDDFESKRFNYSSDEDSNEDTKPPKQQSVSDDIYKEAVLSQNYGQIYLLDYGLASKFLDSEGNHKDFAMDARKAHDGTLEYSSRDSHIGAHSRRSDLEILGFNLLDWLTGRLPWKTTEMLTEPDLVHALKKNFMTNIKSLLKSCFKTEFHPQFMEKYLEYVTNLDFTEKPDYDYCRSIFKAELSKMGLEKYVSLNFSEHPPMSPMNRKKLCYSKRFGSKNTPPDFLARGGVKKRNERENIYSLENDLKLEILKQTLNSSSDGIRKPCSSRNFFISDSDLVARLKKSLMPHDVLGKKLSPKNLRSKRNAQRKKGRRNHRSSIGKFGNFLGSARQFTWAEILAGNPEDIIRKERNNNDSEDEDDDTCKYRIRKLSNASEGSIDSSHSLLLQKDYLLGKNPTYAMKEVINNLKNKIAGKIIVENNDEFDGYEGFTPAMIQVLKSKTKREAKEKLEATKILDVKDTKTTELKVGRTTRSIIKTTEVKVGRTTRSIIKTTEVKVGRTTRSIIKTTEVKVGRTTRSIIKTTEVKVGRTTRSMNNKSSNTTKKPIKNTKNSTDINDKAKDIKAIVTKVDVNVGTEKRVTRSKANNTRNDKNKKVTIQDVVKEKEASPSPSKESQNNKKSETRKKRASKQTFPTNRRRLRSSKRTTK